MSGAEYHIQIIDDAPFHEIDVRQETGYVCDECGQVFDSISGICQHRKQGHGRSTDWESLDQQSVEVFGCPECDYYHESEKMRVVRHFRLSHDGYVRSPSRVYYDCENCGTAISKAKSVDEAPNAGKYCSTECSYEHRFPHPENPNQYWQSRAGRAWREAVYQRDNYTCQDCGVEGNGKNLRAHHIRRRSEHPEDELAVWNGVCLCSVCHHIRHKGEHPAEQGTKASVEGDFEQRVTERNRRLDELEGTYSDEVWDDQPFIEEV